MSNLMPGAGVEPALPQGEGNFKCDPHARPCAPTRATPERDAPTRVGARPDSAGAAPLSAPLPDAPRLIALADYWRKRARAIDVLITHQPDAPFLQGRRDAYADTAAVLDVLVGGIDPSRHAWQQATLVAGEVLRLESPESDVAWCLARLAEAFAAENNARGAAVLWEGIAHDLRATKPRVPAVRS